MARLPRGLWAWYSRSARNYPKTTSLAAGGFLTGVGDLVAQKLGGIDSDVDVVRLAANSTYSAAYASCIYSPFFGFLSRTFGEVGVRAVVCKVAMDTGVLCPLVGIPMYFAWTGFLQNKTYDTVLQTMKQEYMSCYAGALSIWLPVQTLNFTVVPPHLRVTFSYIGQLGWAIVRSICANTELKQEAGCKASDGPRHA